MTDKKLQLKSFLGITTISKVEELLYKHKRNTMLEVTDKLKAWHKTYEENQKQLEESFNYSQIETVAVNFWDDFYDDDCVPEGEVTETCAYVEDSRIPDIECFNILFDLLNHIKGNKLLADSVKLRMYLADSAAEYPNLIDEHSYMMSKRWKIQISNITHEQLDELLPKIQDHSNIATLSIYSES